MLHSYSIYDGITAPFLDYHTDLLLLRFFWLFTLKPRFIYNFET